MHIEVGVLGGWGYAFGLLLAFGDCVLRVPCFLPCVRSLCSKFSIGSALPWSLSIPSFVDLPGKYLSPRLQDVFEILRTR